MNEQIGGGSGSGDPMFDPTLELEYLLAGAKVGKVSIITVYQALLRSPLYAMFDRDVSPETLEPGASALVFDTEDMGNLMVLFTAPELAEKIKDDLGDFGHPAQLSGEYIVSSLAEDTGVILNPGHEYGMKLSGAGLTRLKGDFGTRAGPRPSDGTAPTTPNDGMGPMSGGPPGSMFPSIN